MATNIPKRTWKTSKLLLLIILLSLLVKESELKKIKPIFIPDEDGDGGVYVMGEVEDDEADDVTEPQQQREELVFQPNQYFPTPDFYLERSEYADALVQELGETDVVRTLVLLALQEDRRILYTRMDWKMWEEDAGTNGVVRAFVQSQAVYETDHSQKDL